MQTSIYQPLVAQKYNEHPSLRVYTTKDYSIFKKSEGNRPVNPKHVNRLVRSYEKFGWLNSPLIVNEKMQVVDGQHRLAAAKEMENPISVTFIIVKGYNLQEVQALNLMQSNWSTKDYLHSYADQGLEHYVKLRDFWNENKDFGLSLCAAICANTHIQGVTSTAQNTMHNKIKPVFNEGTYETKNIHDAQKLVTLVRSIQPYFNYYTHRAFVLAIIHLINDGKFKFLDFIKKLQVQPTRLRKCVSKSDYIVLIEEIYNYKRRNKINLRY